LKGIDNIGVWSEVSKLNTVIVNKNMLAHNYVLPEHIEQYIKLREYLKIHLGLNETEFKTAKLQIGDKIVPLGDDALKLRWTNKENKEVFKNLRQRSVLDFFISNPSYILFDDIIYGESIEEEFSDFLKVLDTVATTLDISELIADGLKIMLDDDKLAETFFKRLIAISTNENEKSKAKELCASYKRLDTNTLLHILITGRSEEGDVYFHPLPNLLFTRDIAAVIGDVIVGAAAAKPARRREALLSWLVFSSHPSFKETRFIDMLGIQIEKCIANNHCPFISIEGGDLVVLDDQTILAGLSERTSFAGILEYARERWFPSANGNRNASFKNDSFKRLLAIQISEERSSMHLDTVFTIADQLAGTSLSAMCFEPFDDISKKSLKTYEITPEWIEESGFLNKEIYTENDIENYKEQTFISHGASTLHEICSYNTNYNIEMLHCGGSRQVPDNIANNSNISHSVDSELLYQKREQWTDGANLLALAPGVVITYERNIETLNELRSAGFEVMNPAQFAGNYDSIIDYNKKQPDSPKRVVIKIPGGELSRGRGGPRCMSLPIARSGSKRS